LKSKGADLFQSKAKKQNFVVVERASLTKAEHMKKGFPLDI